MAISGIDLAGKGYVAHRVANRLRPEGVRVAVATPSPWLTSFEEHRSAADPAEDYYQRGVQFPEVCRMLLDPLRETGSVQLTTRITREPEKHWKEYRIDFERVEVFLLESVFLLRRGWRERFDLAYWIECSPATALKRAQYGTMLVSYDEPLVRDFETIRMPAQELHRQRDDPRSYANGVMLNDEGGTS